MLPNKTIERIEELPDDRRLDGGRKIRPKLFIPGVVDLFGPDQTNRRRLETGERKIAALIPNLRAPEGKTAGITATSQAINDRARRIGKAEHLADFIQTFSRGIIPCPGQHPALLPDIEVPG